MNKPHPPAAHPLVVPCGFDDHKARAGLVGFTPYGQMWPTRNITYSFAPDGTKTIFGLPSEMFARMEARRSRAVWQAEYRRALAAWAAPVDLKFTEVPDDGRDSGSYTGTGTVGDIRFCAVNNPAKAAVGTSYYPSGSSLGGDVFINTRYEYGVGSEHTVPYALFDLFSVVLHEIGHALGLAHSTVSPTVMAPTIGPGPVYTGLFPDDVAGIRAIYPGTPPPPPPPTGTAVFVKEVKAPGSWSTGHAIATLTPALPPGVSVTPTDYKTWTWAPNTSDARAVEIPSGAGRIAACWYNPTTFQIAVTVPMECTVSLYCLDWDKRGRVQRVEVLGEATGAVLDTRVVSDFGTSGAWLTYRLSGAVRFRFTNVSSGPNCVVSGVFFPGQ